MNINSDYSAEDIESRGSIELTNMALDAIQNNIIDKVSDQLEIMDFLGFASVRVVLEGIARKAEAYDAMTSNKNHFLKN